MRFSHIVMAYVVIGGVMWGGGVIGWDQAGIGELFIEDVSGGEGTVNEETASQLEQLAGPIQQAAAAVGGAGLLAIVGILLKLFSFLNWPIWVLMAVDAPIEMVVLLGMPLTAAFYASILRLVRGSA